MRTIRWGLYVSGAGCLALGVLLIGTSAPFAVGAIAYPWELPPAVALTLAVWGLAFLGMTAVFWVRAVKLTPGDDILSDRRGLLIALMVLTAALVVGAMLWSMMHLDFWRDTIRGWMSVERPR